MPAVNGAEPTSNDGREVAVLFIHGVEIRDPGYAAGAIRRLKAEIARATGSGTAETRVHIERVYWVPVVEQQQDLLLSRAFPNPFSHWVTRLNSLVHRVDNGSSTALLELVAASLLRTVPGIRRMNWPMLRWTVTHFLGDVIAYQVTTTDRDVYDGIHARVDQALRRLAEQAPDAALCVIAHSLGSVIASDHFYDLQNKKSPAAPSAMERGETLTWFYTLGSPIALWMVRHPVFDRPISLPGSRSNDAAVQQTAQWVNFYDPDDVIAYPLRGLSDAYALAVDEDRAVSVGPPLLRASPLSHVSYWNDTSVMRPIAQRLSMLLAPTAALSGVAGEEV